MCGFHNSTLYYPVYLSTVYKFYLSIFYTLYFAMFQTNMLYLTCAKVNFSCMSSTCSKGCMVSTTLYGVYNSTMITYFSHYRCVPNADMNQSSTISVLCISVPADSIHFSVRLFDPLHRHNYFLSTKGETTNLTLFRHNPINR